MRRRLAAGLLSWMMAGTPGKLLAQQPSGGEPPRRGVSVQMPITTNAVPVPNADTQDALVVALTADGTTYLRGNRLPTAALAAAVKSSLSTRNEKTLYIKADARVPYARVVELIDSVRTSGVEGVTLLTAQPDAVEPTKTLSSPKGLELRVINQ